MIRGAEMERVMFGFDTDTTLRLQPDPLAGRLVFRAPRRLLTMSGLALVMLGLLSVASTIPHCAGIPVVIAAVYLSWMGIQSTVFFAVGYRLARSDRFVIVDRKAGVIRSRLAWNRDYRIHVCTVGCRLCLYPQLQKDGETRYVLSVWQQYQGQQFEAGLLCRHAERRHSLAIGRAIANVLHLSLDECAARPDERPSTQSPADHISRIDEKAA